MKKFKTIYIAVIAFVLLVVVTFTSTDAFQRTSHLTSASVAATSSSTERVEKNEEQDIAKEDILWLARVIYSETKRPHEQELVAWVVRNRVETSYRGNESYRDAVLDPYQFSAFNPNSSKRTHYSGLDWTSNANGFQTALSIAAKVVTADAQNRPFSKTTRHFYSARSMQGGSAPAWALNKLPVKLDRDVEPDRFRFYERIS